MTIPSYEGFYLEKQEVAMNNYLSQPKGTTSKLINKQIIARMFGYKHSDVIFATLGSVITGSALIYEPTSQNVYYTPTGAEGSITSISVTDQGLDLDTDKGSYLCSQANNVDSLRKDLSTPQGLNYVGKVDSLTALRNMEPIVAGQQILLRGLETGSIYGAGTYVYDATASDVDDDAYLIVITTGGKVWKRLYTEHGFIYPEDVGTATDDWSSVITQTMTRSILENKQLRFKQNKTYTTTLPITVPTAFIDAFGVIDFNSATIQMNHVSAPCFVPEDGSTGIKNVAFVNGTISGIGSVDSLWNDTQYNNGLTLGDHSVVNNMIIKNIGNDAVSIPGSYVNVGSYYCDNIRDNALAAYGKYITVNSIVVGHCAGDAVLLKSANTTIHSFQADKAGVPGSNPESGFWAGGGIIFGSQDDVGDSLGTHNYIGSVHITQYGALGIGMNGTDCHVGYADVGSSFYTNETETAVHGNKVYALLMHGDRNSIDTFVAGTSPFGVGFTHGEGHRVGSIKLASVAFQQYYATANINNLVVNSMTFGTGSISNNNNSNFLQATNTYIGLLAVTDTNVATGITGHIVNSSSLTIGRMVLNCAAASAGGTYIEIRSTTNINNLEVNDCGGLALWVRNAGKVPNMAKLSNLAAATRPLYQIERTAILTNWQVTNRSASGGQPTFYNASTAIVGMFAGYSGTKPLNQGSATLDLTVFNYFN